MKLFHFGNFWFLLIYFSFLLGGSPVQAAERFKVLVVFSYEDDYLWDVEIRKEIEKVLSSHADLTFFYMDTKVAFHQGVQKAAEAFTLYQKIKPDGVIAVDDNAQSLFVVPYLKNRVLTPVVFCGVNAEPETYGYPAENVTGILERYHFDEGLALNRQLAGQTQSFVVMINESPLADLVTEKFKTGKDKLSAKLVGILRPRSLPEAINMAQNIRDKVDLLMLLTLKGLVDAEGRPVSDSEAISKVVKAFHKPTIATAAFVVKHGALSGVLTSGQEQGHQVASMLLQAMNGIPLEQLPITRNSQGKRMINVSTLKYLQLEPNPMAFRGAELVRTTE